MGSNFIKWENTIFSARIGDCKVILSSNFVLCLVLGDASRVDNDQKNVVIYFYYLHLGPLANLKYSTLAPKRRRQGQMWHLL